MQINVITLKYRICVCLCLQYICYRTLSVALCHSLEGLPTGRYRQIDRLIDEVSSKCDVKWTADRLYSRFCAWLVSQHFNNQFKPMWSCHSFHYSTFKTKKNVCVWAEVIRIINRVFAPEANGTDKFKFGPTAGCCCGVSEIDGLLSIFPHETTAFAISDHSSSSQELRDSQAWRCWGKKLQLCLCSLCVYSPSSRYAWLCIATCAAFWPALGPADCCDSIVINGRFEMKMFYSSGGVRQTAVLIDCQQRPRSHAGVLFTIRQVWQVQTSLNEHRWWNSLQDRATELQWKFKALEKASRTLVANFRSLFEGGQQFLIWN